MAAVERDYSQVSDLEGKLMLFDFFVIGSVAITLSIIICALLRSELKSFNENNPYYVYAIKTALISVSCTLFIYILKMFFMNNLFVSWDYTSDTNVITCIDSIIVSLKTISKVAFYFGFTYIIQSIFYAPNSETLSLPLKIWMIFVAIATATCIIIKLVADITENEDKEIGIIETYNIYVIMYLIIAGERIAQFAAATIGILDIVYFIILGYFYVVKLRKVDVSQDNGAKGLILVFISCVVFWVAVILVSQNSPMKYIFSGLDVITDNVCLFLMFTSGDVIYVNTCGRICGNCCGKLIYKSKYKIVKFDEIQEDDDDNTDASDVLL
eukprot:149293_1